MSRQRPRRAAREENADAFQQILAQMRQEHQQAIADLRRDYQQAQTGANRRQAEANRVLAQGGIYGYNNGTPLSIEERAFKQLLVGLGVNLDTAHELF